MEGVYDQDVFPLPFDARSLGLRPLGTFYNHALPILLR